MTEQIPFQRTSTLKHRISRTGSVGQDNNNNITGSINISSGINTGIQQQSSIRRASVMQKYMGEIEFTGLNQTARFCKLNSETPDSILRDILKRKWGLKPPTLIITVFGTDFEKKRKLKMIFKKGLWKAAESGCWIVTGGFHLGVMKLTGEAVRDYTDAYGGNRMMAFGVASWDCVTKNEILEAALHEGTAVYQSEEDEEEEAEDSEPILVDPLSQGGIKSVRSDIEERALDPNHNFFVLVDDGTTDQLKGKEAELRARFERCISLWNCASSPQEQTTTVTSQQSGPISSTTHLQQPQNGISTSSNVNNNVNLGGLQRQGSTMGGQASTTSGPQTSATSIGKTSAITGGSSSNSALSKGVSEPVVSNQPVSTASVTRGTKDKLTTESSLKPAKSGKSVGSEEEILVPMCGLVVGGDRFTLRQVYCSMIRNRCPIVVTKGTSGAADVLAFGLDAANKMASEEVVDDKDQVPLEARLESIIEEFLGDLHPDYTNYTDEVNMLCEIINEYTNLVSVFDMEEDSDLDGYVISSLLASAGSTVASDQINLEQLEITLTLNRADIAREKIFLENKKWKKGQLNDYMYQALMSDRHDFVKLFLEQGFSLEDFLTIYMLEKLYTDQLKNLNSKVAIFNKMWEYNRSHRTSKVALRDVGKVIKALVGDFYHPLYLSKEFQAKLMPEKRLEGADICQRLLGSNKLRSSQDYSNMSPSSSSSSTSSSSHHNGAICPRTLGLKDNVRFIDYNEDYDLMNLNSLHLTSPPPPLPPPPPTSTTTVIEEIGFRNPAFLECDKYGTRAIIRRGATSVEPAEKNDGDNDDDDNDYDVDDREDHDDDNEIYGSNMNGFTMNSRLPRSSTTMTTVSGEPLISSNVLRYNDKGNTMGTSTVSHLGSSRIRDGTIQQQYHLNDEGNSSRPHNTDDMSSQLKKSKYLSATRNNDNGNRNGYSSRNKHGRRPSSQTNEHDMLIPGQPLIYNATITNINRSGHSSRGPYTSLGPGHFRITGRAPLAYDATSMGTTTPIQSPKPIINDTLQFSFDNEHVQRNSVLISSIPNEKSNKPVLFEDETINKPSRSCLMSCIQRITSFCSRLFRCNTDTKKVNKGLSLSQESTGIKGPKEFATLRAMAALAAATAATAVADPTKTTQGDLIIPSNFFEPVKMIHLDHPDMVTEDYEEQTKSIQLDRPARELLIWSILVGKLRMAELFWTMEKEPIAAALLASILLTSLGNKTDDFTDKEDYRSFAKNFQERAEGVLNECYREDEHRTQLIINHELIYYGRSSVIKLAAEGQSIKFMAHPCCQDFLTNTWSGNLSTKNSVFRYIMGVVCGLTLPFLIPKVILSKPKTNPTTEGEESSPTSEQQGSTQSNHTMKYVLTAEDAGKKGVRKTLQARTVEYISQIRDFYMAPVVRFVYNTISYITFLILFSYLLLVDFRINITVVEYIVIAWVITLFIEEIKQIAWAVLSGISFRTYISDGWNKLDCAGLALYIIGFILRLIVLLRLGQENNFNIKYERYYIVTDPILDPSRICLAISLFTFYIRLMYTFSFHIALGPKLIMIGKMVTNDLIPFMIILTVIMVGYAVAAQSIAYPNGLFTKENMTLNSEIKHMTFADIIFSMYTTAYFQMFGDFSLDALQGEDRTCQNHMCPTKTSRWLVPIMLGFYVLLTNILMFNLLIAMFSKTYEEIESASTYYWNYQRYQMINDYVHRSPLAPPIIIVWHFYEAYKAIGNQCASLRNAETAKYNPFCVRFTDVKKEREMVKWEHMKAMDYLREPSTKATGKRGVAESRAVVFRGGGGVGPGQGPVMDLKSEMSSVTEGIGMELEKRFKEIDNQFQRFNDVDSRLNDVTQLLTNLSEVISNVTETQQRIIQQINELPTCQCNEFTDEVVPVQKSTTHQTDSGTAETRKRTKLEVAIQSALEAAKDVLRPPTPPPPPPPPPPPQRESPVLLAAVVPGSEDDSSGSEEGGDPSADPVLVPQVPDIKTGRVIERTLGDHRLWRMAPFNFEKYPGMRMNVPPERMAWTVEYPDYFAYDACEEILLFPSEESHDGVNFTHGNIVFTFQHSENLRTINFNQYDAKAKLRRQSLLGRYRLDSTTGAPLNPMGRTGLLGKGLLPRWGPNHSFVLCITRWTRDTRTGAQIIRSNRGVLQYLALERNKRLCMPWYLTDHTSKCDFDECVLKIISSLITRRGHAMLPEKRVDRLLKRIEKAEVTQIFKGYLDDQLNADSAWMETVVINLHESESKGAQLPDDILKLLNEPNTEEQSKWIEVSHSSNLRTSHNYILKNVAELRRAFY